MLQAQKLPKLEEMVGKRQEEEEEPEGEVILGPSGEVVECSSGSAPSFSLSFFFQNLTTSSITIPY